MKKNEVAVVNSRFSEPRQVVPPPATIHVPGSVEEMHEVSKVQKWEKAAWVWAYTTGTGQYTVAEFARLGIAQLRSNSTVHYYRQAWQDAIDSGHAEPVTPGVNILEPVNKETGEPLRWKVIADAENPKRIGGAEMAELYAIAAEEAGTTVGQAIRVGSSKAALIAAIMADGQVEKAVRTALMQKEDQRAQEKGHITNRPDRDGEEADTEFNRIVIKMASIKRLAHQILSLTSSLRGAGEEEKRAYVIDLVGEAHNLFAAISEEAQGNSTDRELQRLLEGDPHQ